MADARANLGSSDYTLKTLIMCRITIQDLAPVTTR